MSIPAINLALSQTTPVSSAGARLVLLRLADRANHAGLAWPTVRSVARDIGLSERQVQRHLRCLERLNLIRVHSPATRTSATTYRVFPGVSLMSSHSRSGGDIHDTGGVTRMTPKPSSKSPKAKSTVHSIDPRCMKTEATVPVLTKLAHQAIDALGPDALIADIAADLKSMCARLRLTATPQDMTSAIASALHQRRESA